MTDPPPEPLHFRVTGTASSLKVATGTCVKFCQGGLPVGLLAGSNRQHNIGGYVVPVKTQ